MLQKELTRPSCAGISPVALNKTLLADEEHTRGLQTSLSKLCDHARACAAFLDLSRVLHIAPKDQDQNRKTKSMRREW